MARIEIRDAARIAQAALVEAPIIKRGEADNSFRARFYALLELCSNYISGPMIGCYRTAEIWPDIFPSVDFFFVIWEIDDTEPVNMETKRVILNGCLHHHRHDNTWGIHT